MNQITLLPNRFKIWGWVLMLLGIAVGLYTVVTNSQFGLEMRVPSIFNDGVLSEDFQWFKWITNDVTDELLTFCIIVGGLLVGFSAEPDEDELMALLRLKALTWAVVANYSILLLATALVYDFSYLNVMIYNMFTVILIFVARYQYLLYSFRKAASA